MKKIQLFWQLQQLAINVLIFKGNFDKNNEKGYNKLEVVKNKRIFIFFQEYLEYEKKLQNKCLLLLDKAPPLATKNLLYLFRK